MRCLLALIVIFALLVGCTESVVPEVNKTERYLAACIVSNATDAKTILDHIKEGSVVVHTDSTVFYESMQRIAEKKYNAKDASIVCKEIIDQKIVYSGEKANDTIRRLYQIALRTSKLK